MNNTADSYTAFLLLIREYKVCKRDFFKAVGIAFYSSEYYDNRSGLI